MIRIQRKRVKGWRMPANSRYVGRPTRYGNPYPVKKGKGRFWIHDEGGEGWIKFKTKEDANKKSIELFEKWLDKNTHLIDELRNYDALACFCALSVPCHADVYIKRIENEQ